MELDPLNHETPPRCPDCANILVFLVNRDAAMTFPTPCGGSILAGQRRARYECRQCGWLQEGTMTNAEVCDHGGLIGGEWKATPP